MLCLLFSVGILLSAHNQVTTNKILTIEERTIQHPSSMTSTKTPNPQSSHHTPTDQVCAPWPQSREPEDQQAHLQHLSPKP